jgi:hypothetical protein
LTTLALKTLAELVGSLVSGREPFAESLVLRVRVLHQRLFLS